MVLYLLYESAIGYALFKLKSFDETNAQLTQIQNQVKDFGLFSQICEIKGFIGFNAQTALENVIQVCSGQLSENLQTFLEQNIQKSKKQGVVQLAVQDNKLAKEISEKLGIECKTNDNIFELFRGIRQHFVLFLKSETFTQNDLDKAELGLAHQFSRTRIALDVKRQDKPIIQSSAVLEQLDKDLNTFCMRIKEWYSWHFPELQKIVTDNEIYVKLVDFIKDKQTLLKEDLLQEVANITLDQDIAQQIIDAAKQSMGQEFSESDQQNIELLCKRVLKQFTFRKELAEYLKRRMMEVAPNLTTIIGETVGAKLISHSGGLSNLVKYPASTVQILGAEKALFRALKTKTNTPKYGILYNSTYIGKAQGKDKGKISRYLANKCSIAARLDHFLIKPSSQFGEKMKNQIEERMKFLTSGGATTKNIDAMEQVMQELKQENLYFETEEYVEKKKKKDKKKQKKLQEQTQQQIEEENIAEEPVQQDEQKKKKKKKKDDIQDEQQEDIKQQIDEVSQDKKTKKMKKSKIEQE
eukprot:TRINITY_DN786_c0_g1_i3.p1 TRINITY_DN786_c0_g1~~TRINITY_DN786_c0_g1_i3.p1  ORF type:complete len:525 (+),score=126.29 TRINITY_DN786_c0_g1_i3:48-1622(+)